MDKSSKSSELRKFAKNLCQLHFLATIFATKFTVALC